MRDHIVAGFFALPVCPFPKISVHRSQYSMDPGTGMVGSLHNAVAVFKCSCKYSTHDHIAGGFNCNGLQENIQKTYIKTISRNLYCFFSSFPTSVFFLSHFIFLSFSIVILFSFHFFTIFLFPFHWTD